MASLLSKIKTRFLSVFSEKDEGLKPGFESRPKPPTKALSSGLNSLRSILGMADKNPDEVLKREGISIFDEMPAKDPHLYAVYQTRKLAVSRIPWVIEPASSSAHDKKIADFVLSTVSDCRGPFSEDLFQLMDAVGKGFSCLEIQWKEITSGKWAGKFGVKELVFHPQKFWSFQNAKNSSDHKDKVFFGENSFEAKIVPWSKVIHLAFDAQDSLYGRAAFRTVYWHWWFKKESWKWWIQYLEKYASPTAVGKFPLGSSTKQIDDLLETLESLQQETSVAIPDQLSVELLEASRSGPASYRDMSDAVNAEISKAILGATQTVEEGRRGSYSLSRAHSQVRQERVEADGILLSDTVEEQLVKRIVDFNFITEVYPQFLMKYPFDVVDSRSKGKTLELPKYFKHAEDVEGSLFKFEEFISDQVIFLMDVPDNGPIWASFASLGKYLIVKKSISDLSVNEITTCRHSGRYRGVSIGKDKDGFFVTTHRARSKSYKSVLDIPVKVIHWIASTG